MTRGILLLQDNTPAHTSQVAMAAATECGFEVLPHPLYSPDLAPSDFCLFPKLKSNLSSRTFRSNEGVIDAVNEYLGDQHEDFYFEGISKLEQRWRKCVKMKGDYFEKEWQTFHSWVFRSTGGRELSDHTSYFEIYSHIEET